MVYFNRKVACAIAFVAGCTLWSNEKAYAACPPGYPAGLPCPQEAWETVGLEHQDRINRLRSLQNGNTGFQFFPETISKEEHRLSDFPADIPVLRVVANQDVFFDSGSDVIRLEAYPLLDTISQNLMKEPPDVSLFVAGHTDGDGDEGYNYELGLRRAQSVAAALVRRGIYQASIYRVSFGELLPMDSNETFRGKARNRRVEFLFAARPTAIVNLLARFEIPTCAEEYRDTLGRCKVPIQTEAVKLEIAPENKARIIELEQQARANELNRSLTKIQLDEKRLAIEAERQRIPIEFSPVKIPISIGYQ